MLPTETGPVGAALGAAAAGAVCGGEAVDAAGAAGAGGVGAAAGAALTSASKHASRSAGDSICMQRRASIVTLSAAWPNAVPLAPANKIAAERHSRKVEQRSRRSFDGYVMAPLYFDFR
jgi:hypothetical protein